MKETLEKGGYAYVRFDHNAGLHVLRYLETGKLEYWAANKNHASYGLIWRNTHLEFVSEVNA